MTSQLSIVLIEPFSTFCNESTTEFRPEPNALFIQTKYNYFTDVMILSEDTDNFKMNQSDLMVQFECLVEKSGIIFNQFLSNLPKP